MNDELLLVHNPTTRTPLYEHENKNTMNQNSPFLFLRFIFDFQLTPEIYLNQKWNATC